MRLLHEHATNDAGDSLEVKSFGSRSQSHLYTLFVWGTFGGGTVTIQASPDNVEWFNITDLDALTAKAIQNLEIRAPYMRAVVAGGTAASLNVYLF